MPAKQREPQALLPRPLHVVSVVVLLVFAIVPVLYMLLLSVTPDDEVTAGPLLPSRLEFGNYGLLWETIPLASGLVNSLVASGFAALIATLLAVGAGYCLARFTFFGRRPYLYALVGLQSVPGTMMLLPLFAVYASVQQVLNLLVIGSRGTLVLTYLTFALPFATWIMLSYIQGIPRSLDEAALVDGAGRITVLWRVVMPLAWPGMVVAFVFSFLLGWNDVLFASVLTGPGSETAAVSLQAFSQSTEAGGLPLYGQMMGAAVLSAVPVVVLYMILQRYLLSGLTAGGVKG